MTDARLIAVGSDSGGSERVNVFIHGYRSMASEVEVDKAKRRVLAAQVTGENHLLDWTAGRWRDSATVAGLRAAYKATRWRYALSPLSLLVDAGLIGTAEAAQFKRMERRAEEVGARLPDLLRPIAAGRPINLIGHSLGARVVHHALAKGDLTGLWFQDAILLVGAADLNADDWPDCIERLGGCLYNAYSRSDRVLKITPDLRKRVGSRPMPQVVIDGKERVVNHDSTGLSHVKHWTKLAELLPAVWPDCCSARGA